MEGGETNIMDTHILLNFGTSLGGSRTFRVPHVRNGFLPSDVQAAMNMMISAAPAFDESRGRPSVIRGATLVSVESTPITVAGI